MRAQHQNGSITSRRCIAAVLVCGAFLVAGVSAASAAKLKLTTENAPSKRVSGGGRNVPYGSGETVWAGCKSKGTPLMLGWSGVRAPVAIMYSNNLKVANILGFAIRNPLDRSATVRTKVLCARGAVKAKIKDGTSGRVSCSAGRIAIGVPIDGGPYWTESVYSVPDGTRGWRTSSGKSGRAKVICVAASAFRSVKVVRKRSQFRVGATETRVTAKCRSGSRPISWGFEAGVQTGNAWNTPATGPTISVPFITSSKSTGKTGWSLVFSTPDGKPATGHTEIGLAITCAKPR